MWLVEQGIWDEGTTNLIRAQNEWPNSVWEAIPSITSALASETSPIGNNIKPIVIQIGPSHMYPEFPESELLIRESDSSTLIYSLDTNAATTQAIKDHFMPRYPRLSAIQGNGWHFLSVLTGCGVPIEAIQGNVGVILAANNLSIVVKQLEASGDIYRANKLMNEFLDQAKIALHPKGEIILISSKAALHIGLAVLPASHDRVFTIPDYGYTEMHSGTEEERVERSGVIFKTWNPWLSVLRSRTDAFIEERNPELVSLNRELILKPSVNTTLSRQS